MISVIIPAYNEARYIHRSLRSLQRQNFKGEYEVIVVDNNSADNTAEVAKKYGARVVKEKHRGVSWARQKGVDEARGEILAWLDADTKASENWLNVINQVFKKDPKLVAASGSVFYYDIKNKQLEDLVNALAFTNLIVDMAIKKLLRKGLALIGGGNYAMKKSAIKRIGGWNKKIKFYGEDLDMLYRLSKIGKVKFVPRLVAYTSFRRFRQHGFLETYLTYAANVFWLFLFNRPLQKEKKIDSLVQSIGQTLKKIKEAIEKDESLY